MLFKDINLNLNLDLLNLNNLNNLNKLNINNKKTY